jgi:hypothetical protein
MTANVSIPPHQPTRTVRRRRVVYVFAGYSLIVLAVILRADPASAAWLWQLVLALGGLTLLTGLLYLLRMRQALLPEAQFQLGARPLDDRHLSEQQWRRLALAQMNAYRILGGVAVCLSVLYWTFLPTAVRLIDTDSLALIILAGVLLLIPNLPNALLVWTLDEGDEV